MRERRLPALGRFARRRIACGLVACGLVACGLVACGLVACGLVACGLVACGLVACGGAGGTARPDVVLVLIDTLRADHLEAYGYERASAPFLSSVAARGVLFRNAFSTSSWTPPAAASVFTGLYPTRHTVTKGIKADGDTRETLAAEGAARIEATAIPAAIRTLPQFFQDAGYHTMGVAANINIGSALGFDRGFDAFEHMHRSSAEELSASIRAMHDEAGSDRPRFTYIHFNDVHGPYAERAPWYRAQSDPFRDRIERYDSEISYVDDVLGRLHEDLAWDRDTIFCVVTDHGEEFKDHGNTGHGFSLFGEVQRVVMILAAPTLDGAPAVVDANVSLVDVLPTILDLAGLAIPLDADGRSLVPLMEPAPAPDDGAFAERPVFAHLHAASSDRPMVAVIRGRWKLVQYEGGVQRQLYDLAEDPGEDENVARQHARVVRELRGLLAEWLQRPPPAPDAAVTIEVDEALLEQLEAMGYGGDKDD